MNSRLGNKQLDGEENLAGLLFEAETVEIEDV